MEGGGEIETTPQPNLDQHQFVQCSLTFPIAITWEITLENPN